MSKRTENKPGTSRVRKAAGTMPLPNEAPARKAAANVAPVSDRSFAEGTRDGIDSDLRQRMIGETAYRLFVERGCTEGCDLDDWLQAEAEVDRLLLGSPSH